MSNSISHASIPYPIKNARFTILIAFLDADGDPTDPTTPDTEVSQDGGAFADAAEEVTTISGSNGTGYVTLTGAETNNSAVAVAFKVASGPKATLATLYPRNLPILASGTASAGAAGSITLASGITYDITGCFVRTTGGTGGGGVGGANNQARRVTAYNTATQAATVTPSWETTPDATTTYDVLCPEGVTPGMLKALGPTTAGRTLDVSSGGEAGVDWANVGSPTTVVALSGTTVGVVTSLTGLAAGAITATAIAADALTAAKIADGAIDRATFAADTGLQPGRSNTAAGGAAGSVTLDASASAVDDYYKDSLIFLTGGTGAGQARTVSSYVGSTKVANVTPNWATSPDATSTFAVLPRGTVTGATAPTAADVADAVWDELRAGHVVANSFGAGVLVGGYVSGQAPLQPTVAGRTLDVSAGGEAGLDWGNVGSPTTTVGLSGTTVGVVSTLTTYTGNTVQTGDNYARLGAPAGASHAADVAAVKSDTGAVKTKTDQLTFTVALHVDATAAGGGGGSGVAGSGAISYVYTVTDSVTSDPVAGVDVWVTTDSAGANVVAGTLVSDAFGKVTFNLDAGTYYLFKQLAGYSATNPQTITVS